MAYTTINKSSLNMNTKLYTGNGNANNAITGVGFQPDWVWIKDRDNVRNHVLNDAVRGATKNLFSNTDGAESTDTSTLTAFNSDGFTLGNGTKVNGNSINFASWNWKAGSSVSGNTSGAGTAKAYSGSVNTGAGFSIIKYVGNGTADHTIPHRLGVKPKMIITKNLDSAITWIVGHDSIGWDHILFLDSTAAKADDANAFNDIAPTSSVWNVGSGNGNNANNANYVSYCFSEVKGYSKFGSYVGNGNADGTFIYTGFKPAFVLTKNISGTNNWTMCDNKRNTFNAVDKVLNPNVSGAEAVNNPQDFVSNGFKNRATESNTNASGSTYIYMAFAEAPLVGTNNVAANAR